jgi:gamma-glutamyl hydrolase
VSYDPNILSSFDAENITLPLDFTPAATTSKLYGPAPSGVWNTLSEQNVTMNNHQSGVAPVKFATNDNLTSFFNVLSTNLDRNGIEFISSIEAKKYPIFATQVLPHVSFEAIFTQNTVSP